MNGNEVKNGGHAEKPDDEENVEDENVEDENAEDEEEEDEAPEAAEANGKVSYLK